MGHLLNALMTFEAHLVQGREIANLKLFNRGYKPSPRLAQHGQDGNLFFN
jgi:hypothetical protein